MDMVEKVARAIGKLDGIPDELWSASVPHARAAIAAMREPTAWMLAEADAAMRERIVEGPSRFTTLRAGYSAMIDAALTSSEK